MLRQEALLTEEAALPMDRNAGCGVGGTAGQHGSGAQPCPADFRCCDTPASHGHLQLAPVAVDLLSTAWASKA